MYTSLIMRPTERTVMLRIFKKNEPQPVDDLIRDVLNKMNATEVDTEEYPKLMVLLERLYELKTKQRRAPVSSDTIALVAGNLMGILLIVAYEQKHVMTSKGFGHIIKPK